MASTVSIRIGIDSLGKLGSSQYPELAELTFRMLKEFLGLQIIVCANFGRNPYDMGTNGTFYGLVGGLTNNEIDLTLPYFTPLLSRTKVADISTVDLFFFDVGCIFGRRSQILETYYDWWEGLPVIYWVTFVGFSAVNLLITPNPAQLLVKSLTKSLNCSFMLFLLITTLVFGVNLMNLRIIRVHGPFNTIRGTVRGVREHNFLLLETRDLRGFFLSRFAEHFPTGLPTPPIVLRKYKLPAYLNEHPKAFYFTYDLLDLKKVGRLAWLGWLGVLGL